MRIPLLRLLAALALLTSLGVPDQVAAQVTPTPEGLVTDAPGPTAPDEPATQAGEGPSGAGDLMRPVPGGPVPPPDVTAAGWVLYDPLDRVVLAGREPTVGRPMASTTKVLTVLLALEELERGGVPPSLTVSREAAAVGQIAGAASLGLEAGDVVDVRELLAALVLRSGNDAAVAVAEHVAGSETAFVGRMNTRAVELRLFDTGFVNSTGLTDDVRHHASPLDLALIADVAMAHDDFAAWAGAETLTLPTFGTLENRNELLGAFPGATGVKTGFTNLAGLCLVASAERDGRRLYAVVLGSEDSFADAAALLDLGFAAYRRPAALEDGEEAGTYRLGTAAVPLVASGALTRTVAATADVRWRTTLQAEAAAPLVPGAPLGKAELIVDGESVAEVPLVAGAAVPAPSQEDPSRAVGTAVVDAVRAFARLTPIEREVA